MSRAWVFVGITIAGIVAGQLLLKAAIDRRGPIPASPGGAVGYLWHALLDPMVILGLALAFVGAVSWIAALSRLELGVAYPFMGLAFILTVLFSSALLRESVSLMRWSGIVVVVLGLILVARG